MSRKNEEKENLGSNGLIDDYITNDILFYNIKLMLFNLTFIEDQIIIKLSYT